MLQVLYCFSLVSLEFEPGSAQEFDLTIEFNINIGFFSNWDFLTDDLNLTGKTVFYVLVILVLRKIIGVWRQS